MNTVGSSGPGMLQEMPGLVTIDRGRRTHALLTERGVELLDLRDWLAGR